MHAQPNLLSIILVLLQFSWKAGAFLSPSLISATAWASNSPQFATVIRLPMASQIESEFDEEGEIVEPGKMRVSEIKAELEMRGVPFADCFDKDSLVLRLQEARATGEANPEILERFNRNKIESNYMDQKLEIKDDDIDQAVANDGTLPGGMKPDQFKKLASNPEIMALLQSPKMQEAMKLMMTGGREELESKVKADPELQETVAKLDGLIRSMQ